jgi:hypothetical protein
MTMSQITLYLDEPTEEILVAEAAASGLSKSRWVAELIRANARQQWPDDFLALAGSLVDFPLDITDLDLALDAPRIGF